MSGQYDVALVSQSPGVTPASLAAVAAALQKQITYHFTPAWGISATVSPFPTLQSVPVGYWPIVVRPTVEGGLNGIHQDDNGQPISLVRAQKLWPLSASHECMEMLSDPWGKWLVAGTSLLDFQGQVQYLVECADPCDGPANAYSIDGVPMSDFCYPAYYGLDSGTRYSHSGRVQGPLTVLPGGYVSWHDPLTNHWFQCRNIGGSPSIADVGLIAPSGASLRVAIDRLSQRIDAGSLRSVAAELPKPGSRLRGDATKRGREAHAKRWQQIIDGAEIARSNPK